MLAHLNNPAEITAVFSVTGISCAVLMRQMTALWREKSKSEVAYTLAGGLPPDDLKAVPGHCFQIQPKTRSSVGKTHCNNTPYWILSSDGSIIPDHGTIFTDRLIRFIGDFLPPGDADLISPPRLTTPRERLAKTTLGH